MEGVWSLGVAKVEAKVLERALEDFPPNRQARALLQPHRQVSKP